MTEPNDTHKRLSAIETDVGWLKERVWSGTGNLHDRVHKIEDRSADRTFEMDALKEDVKNIKTVVGLDGYGGRNLISDLRDALDTIDKLKEGVITIKDFQSLVSDVKQLKERGQAQITLINFIQFGIIGAVISLLVDLLKTALWGTP